MKTIIYFLLSIFLSNFAYADAFTRSYEFKAIHIERDQFFKAATEIYEYFEKINNMPAKGYVSLGREDYQTEINFPIGQRDYEKFQRISYNGRVIIEARDGVIKSCEFWFSDNSRKVTVTGASQDYISGVINFTIEKFRPNETKYGGTGFRFILAAVFFILIFLLIGVAFYSFRENNVLLIIFFISCMLVPNVILFLPPWELIFPGFIVSSENMSFFEKNAALFTFLGLIVTLLMPIISAFKILRKKKIQPTPK